MPRRLGVAWVGLTNTRTMTTRCSFAAPYSAREMPSQPPIRVKPYVRPAATIDAVYSF